MRKFLFLFLLLFIGIGITVAQKPVLTIPSGQNSWISAFSITPNGQYLVSAAMDRSVKIFDLKSKREVFTFWGHRDYVQAIAIAPDNRTVMSGDQYGDIVFWDLNSGKILKRDTVSHSRNVMSIDVSKDGKSMLSADWDGTVAKWDLQKMDTIYRYRYHDYPITKVNFSASGKYFMSISPDTLKTDTLHNIEFVNTATGDTETSTYLSSALFRSASLSLDEKYIYYVTENPAEIRKYDAFNAKGVSKQPISDGLPLDILTLDAKTVVIICRNTKRRAVFLVYDMDQQKVLKKITTDVFVSDILQGNAILQKYPSKSNTIAFINGFNLSVYSLDLNTEKLEQLNSKQTAYQGNPILLNNQLYLGGEDNILKKWDFKTNQITPLFTDTSHIYYLANLGKHLLLSSYEKWMVWDKETNKIIKTIVEPNAGNAAKLFIDETQQSIAIPLINDQVNIYNASDYSLRKVLHIGFSPSTFDMLWHDAHTLAFIANKDGSKIIYFYDVDKETFGQKINSKYSISKLAKLNDSLYVTGISGGVVRVFNRKTDQMVIERRLRPSGNFQYLTYNAKLNQVIVSPDDGAIYFLNPLTLVTEKVLEGHQSWIVGLEFDEDYHRLYSTSYDNSIKIWDFKQTKELSTFVILNEKEWATLGQQNLFDASQQAMKLMYYVVNDSEDLSMPWKIIELDQLKHRYYQPGLLQIQMGYNKEPLRSVPALDNIELAPKLKIIISGQSMLGIHLKNQRGGIGKVAVYLNNAEVIADARPKGDADKNLPELQINIDLNRFADRFLNEDKVLVKVIAWNGANWLSTAPDTISLHLTSSKGTIVKNTTAKKPLEKPRLFALVFGTSDYGGTQIDLRYAGKDAADFSGALKLSAQKLFGVGEAEVNLFNSEASELRQPTKKNLITAMQELAKKMKPTDILVVYLSGHGVNFGGTDGDFYYLTKEATGADATYLADPAIRNTSAVSSAELTTLLNQITARKKMLILDACASGKAAETMLAAARDVPSSQVRALDRMQDRTGFYILSGSASDAVSYESSVYGQGLLTYSLLKAMRGASLRIDGAEEYVDIQKLLQYAVDEVPKLAEGIGGIQKPLYRSPDNQQSFDIGKIDEETKKAIVLAEPKPVFVAVGLQDPLELFDKLNLSEKINAALRENTTKGKTADFVFTEAKDYPGAYRISGTYELKNGELSLKYVLIKDKTRVGDVRTFTANFKDAVTFADAFINELKQNFKK